MLQLTKEQLDGLTQHAMSRQTYVQDNNKLFKNDIQQRGYAVVYISILCAKRRASKYCKSRH